MATILVKIIMIMNVGALIILIPAFLLAGIVNRLTSGEMLAGIAFLLIAVIAR